MKERTVSRVEGWESQPFSGGYATLRELADGGFSGVVRSGPAWLFMLNGRVVGVPEGSIEDFEGAEGTAYRAPHPSLPLLFAMLEEGGEQQAKYYTNDTPISEAHQQLSDASFTGYVELSENVLSGDYYVAYYGGRSMSCAFVGNSERLVAGEEAFEMADDEVGIYEVRSVDLEVVDVPEPADDLEPDAGEGAAATAGGQRGGEAEPAGGREAATEQAGDREADAGTGPDQPADPAAGEADAGTGPDQPADPAAGEADAREREVAGEAGTGEPGDPPDPEPGPGPTDGQADAAASGQAGTRAPGAVDGAGRPAAGDADAASTGSEPGTDSGTANAPGSTSGATGGGGAADGHRTTDAASGAGAGDRGTQPTGARVDSGDGVPKSRANHAELRAIPSLSPDRTRVAEPGAEAAVTETEGSASSDDASTGVADRAGPDAGASVEETTGTRSTDAAPGADRANAGAGGGAASGAGGPDVGSDTGSGGEPAGAAAPDPVPDDADATELRQQLRVREERIEELEAALTDLQVQRDGLKEDRDRLQTEVQRLESEVAELESEVERLRGRLNDGTEGKRRLSRDEALAGTNLFIRYGSKSGGTLEKAHAGEVGREEVNNNLRLEHHTQFDADSVVVDGEDFETFLSESIYRQFVEWVVRDLLYEIVETGHVKGLRDLYDAIPNVDRAELVGDVSVQFTEDGEQYREQRSFDVVLRDRMGNPLVVANLNDARNPADHGMMETIIDHASDVKESNEMLSSAMMVTASFFEPGALEAADEAASGGFLSRDSKESFVKIARKSGYHLVLVESRSGEFHVNVPEL